MDKSFPYKVALLLIAMIFCCAAGFYLLHVEHYGIALGCFAGMLLPAWVLFKSIKHLHKKIDYFISAISNDDYAFRFPSHKKMWSGSTDLSRQLNRVKEAMQQKHHAMQEQEKYYEILLAKINSGVVLVNATGHVIQANQFALTLLGREIFTHLTQLESFAPELYGVLQTIRSGEQHKVAVLNEKERTDLLVQASFIVLRGKAYKLFVINDIKQLLDEQEMEIWVKLFRILSHEIMNSITPITSLSDSLLQLQNDPESAQTLKEDTIYGLQVINETGKGLLSFVESYQRLLRIPTPRKEFLDGSDFFNGIILLCSHLPYFNKVRISLNIAPDAPPLYADGNLLGQVMINLVKNAIQSIEHADFLHGEVCLNFQKTPEGNALIEVSDNGPGIAPDLVNQIFVPFFTTKSEGSGIGLSIARQIMRAHGGRIQVQSLPGQPTKFSLYFPI
ncbi:MAG: ATP-binding protein [Bacteroidales bacterium]|nr:ATP-binding protein [Bacteroidales bacterium]MCL2739117.1 ATP-binding protein [Bacteroidales bacterium]